MTRHAAIELTENLVLRITAIGDVDKVEAMAALNRIGAHILYDALGEYLGLKAKSAGRRRSTTFVGDDLTQHRQPERKDRVVKLAGPLGGVVRLDAEDLRRGRKIIRGAR
jgi:hypothetical protein